ncbi:hypothetical protein GAY31_19825 [Azospirillum brasilense]|nr:hypothetical protein [Azospirillum brasilense]
MAKSYLESWKKAKDRFEKATGKKKPDPKSRFGKLFSKISSTGLESALKSYDAAKTVKDAQKHARAFKTAASSYIPTLDTAQARPPSRTVMRSTPRPAPTWWRR